MSERMSDKDFERLAHAAHDNWAANAAQYAEARRARASEATLRAQLLDIHDALHASCDGTVDLPTEIRALRAQAEEHKDCPAALAAAKSDHSWALLERDEAQGRAAGLLLEQTANATLRAQVEEMRRALEEISDPIAHVQRKAKAAGDVINGVALVSLSKDPHWPRQRAKDALAALSTPKEPRSAVSQCTGRLVHDEFTRCPEHDE